MENIIKAAVERGASDLHIKAGDVFRARIDGTLVPLTKQRLSPEQTKAIAIKLIPPEVLSECREKAHQMFAQDQPPNRWAAAVIITIWLIGVLLLAAFTIPLIQNRLPGQ